MDQKVVICGIARDNQKELTNGVIKYIEKTGKAFSDYRVVIFENDSSDGTKQVFKHWREKNPKVIILSEDFHNKKRPSIKFMAECRNKYLDYIKTKIPKEFKYIIVVDLDMQDGWDVKEIVKTINDPRDWGFVGSNGIEPKNGKMYDMFAFRTSTFNYPYDGQKSYWDKIVSHQEIMNSDDWIPVHSCFGGLGIYKRESIGDCRYDSVEEDCEHVYLHNCMRKDGERGRENIFLNTKQILKYNYNNVKKSNVRVVIFLIGLVVILWYYVKRMKLFYYSEYLF